MDQTERRHFELSAAFDFLSDLFSSGFYGKVIINVQDGVIKDLKTEQNIKMASIHEYTADLESDEESE
jgi:hypothetical protein